MVPHTLGGGLGRVGGVRALAGLLGALAGRSGRGSGRVRADWLMRRSYGSVSGTVGAYSRGRPMSGHGRRMTEW
jgi:hypothetical protein